MDASSSLPTLQTVGEPLQPIDRVTDEDFAKIFSYLDPLERLGMTNVCRKWSRAAGLLWTDVTALDLAPLPEEKMGKIVGRCPNLKSMVATLQTVPLNALNANLHGSLQKIALLNVNLAIEEKNSDLFSSALLTHFERLPIVEELIWHNVFATDLHGSGIKCSHGFVLPINECGLLTKLHLTGRLQINALQLFDSLRRLPNIKCLTLGNGLYGGAFAEVLESFRQSLRAMGSLKELCLIDIRVYRTQTHVSEDESLGATVFGDFYELLLRLEVFVLVETGAAWYELILSSVPKWVELHPALRLLVIAVNPRYGILHDGETLVPPRRRYPKGFGSDALPFLNVFIGGIIAEHLRFSQSTNARIWPISEELPKFLAGPEIAEIASGIWSLGVFKDAAKRLTEFWFCYKTVRNLVNYFNLP